MKDNLVSFETAKMLKEKGFDWNCDYVEQLSTGEIFYTYRRMGVPRYLGRKEEFSGHFVENTFLKRPTQSLAQRWLREKFNIHIKLHSSNTNRFSYEIYEMIPPKGGTVDANINSKKDYKTYEEALEAGLQKSLKLIA